MGAVRWSEGAVVSIPLAPDLHCLAQMLHSPYMVFFDVFSPTDVWDDVDLADAPVLFHRAVTRQFVRWSRLRKVSGIRPRVGVELPRRWLAQGPGSQLIRIWSGEPEEMDVMTFGEEGVRVVEKSTEPGAGSPRPLTGWLTGPDHPELDLYELDTLAVHPETTVRLRLCHHFGRNVDPDKDLVAGRPLPREYAEYYAATMR